MSATITTVDSKGALPIAQVEQTGRVIYLKEVRDNIKKPIVVKNEKTHEKVLKCPYCKICLPVNSSYLYHIKNDCKPMQLTPLETSYATDFDIIPIPQEMHNIIFLSGAPRSGKTYWINMYATEYKKLFKREIFYFTRNEFDDSLTDGLYTRILTSEIEAPFQMDELANSLCIFDDIEDSQYPKVTKYLYTLMDDLIKNGRHAGEAGISVIFANQETTMYRRTKTILSQMTEFVMFPAFTAKNNAMYVMDKYLGMNRADIHHIYTLPSRWVSIRRIAPQFVVSQHHVYLLSSNQPSKQKTK